MYVISTDFILKMNTKSAYNCNVHSIDYLNRVKNEANALISYTVSINDDVIKIISKHLTFYGRIKSMTIVGRNKIDFVPKNRHMKKVQKRRKKRNSIIVFA